MYSAHPCGTCVLITPSDYSWVSCLSRCPDFLAQLISTFRLCRCPYFQVSSWFTVTIYNYVHTTVYSWQVAMYHTAGFVCEVLICVNYVSYRGLVNFNPAVTVTLSFQLTAHVTVPCLWFLCPMSPSKEWTFLLDCLTVKAWKAWPKNRGGCKAQPKDLGGCVATSWQ